MRSSTLLSAAFAGCALGSPLVKRDLVVEIDTFTDVVYTTAYVTETAGASPVAETTPTSTAEVETSSAPVANNFYKAQKDWFSFSWSTSTISAVTEVATSAVPESTSSAATSSAVATTTSVAPLIDLSVSVSLALTPSSTYVSSSVPAATTSSAAEVSSDSSNSFELERRAGTPTCNPNNVRILTNYFPSPTAYCKRLQAAMPSPTNKLVPDLNLKQSNNICSCVLAGSYVSNTPLTKTSTASTAKATTYQQKVLVHHNVHRANHSASDVTWSSSLASTAQKIAESCVYAHDTTTDGGGYGQNIAAGVTSDNIATVISDLFYNGEVNSFSNLYGQANPDMSDFHSWGHFSQIVWKGTTQVACATVDCSSKGLQNVGSNVPPYFTVCNYKTPGNYGGEYAANIGSPLNRATADHTYGV